jgi:pyruvate/2-oxoglutarate dehydrogenase complex dihydrolipoamide acyltransferase (E2) component
MSPGRGFSSQVSSSVQIPSTVNGVEPDEVGLNNGEQDMAIKARDGTMAMEDMDGGTFTISNGGTFGSLMGALQDACPARMPCHNLTR